MRRFLGLSLGVLVLAACGEMKDPSTVDVLPEEDPALPTGSEIYDGASGQEGANPHFYFLSPVADGNPAYSGVADDNLRPTVTICPLVSWDTINEVCTGDPIPTLATFTMEPDAFNTVISVDPGFKYSVVWKTNNYPVTMVSSTESIVYRVAVSVAAKVLGWVDAKGYDNQTYNSFQHTDPDGNVAISANGNLNINFRIEDGALEAAYCDPSNLEDCDVEVFSAAEEGCLRVFENPNGSGQALGSQACVPANAATLNDVPVEGDFAVILTLEKSGVTQGGSVPGDYQIPYFPDVKTDPPGISFDPGSSGLGLVICQVEGPGALPESLHSKLRPVLVFIAPNGTTETTLPTEYSYGAPECEDFASMASHDHQGQEGEEGLLSRVAQGFSRVTSLFLPKPLVARRLHGGLNTTVYNTGGDATPGGENVAPLDTGTGETRVEAYGILPADAKATVADFPAFSGLEETEVAFSVTPYDGLGRVPLYDFWAANGEPVTVEWWVEGANPNGSATQPNQAPGPDAENTFDASYTPTEPGYDYIHITVNGEEIAGSPFTYEVLPLTGPIEVYIQITSNSGGAPAPADGLPVKLYRADGTVGTATTVATGTPGEAVATFDDEYSGSYTVYLPKRDFDVHFDAIETPFEHSPNLENPTGTVTMTGTSYPLQGGVAVFRIREVGGTGNAYQFVADNRSWVSAQNQIRYVTLSDGLVDVTAHLATIKSLGENDHVKNLVLSQCPDLSRANRCARAWIGLTDEVVDGTFVWVNEEGPLDPGGFLGWADKEPSGKNNEDYVEIDLFGKWRDENGASSTNDGYITEYDAQQPPPNPTSGG